MNTLNKKEQAKFAKKLIGFALTGFYYFDDDAVEEFIDRLDLKFQGRVDRHKLIRGALMSNPKLYPIVADVACKMWA